MIPYLLFFLITIFLSSKVSKSDVYLIPLWIFASLFVGLRYGVGTDYFSYEDIYNTYSFYLEIGFQYVVNFLNDRHLPVWSLFLTMAAMTYFFMYAFIYKNNSVNRFAVTLLLTLCTYSFICNGVRQGLAIAIFLFATRFIIERNIYFYILFILFASMFHNSILICLPLYFLNARCFRKQTYISMYIFSFLFTQMDLSSLTSPFMFLIERNDRYLSLLDNDLYTKGYFSLGVLLIILNNIIIFIVALKLNIEKIRPLWFNFFFFSIVFMNMRVASPLFVRVQVIFGWFVCLLIPVVVQAIRKKQNKWLFVCYYIVYTAVTTISYLLSPESKLYPYHDVIGIF